MENPLIALLASPGADSRVLSRGFTSVAQLLSPFTTLNIDIRDPSNGQYVSNKISLDVRDLRRHGHLLSLSVLPYVLQEALESKSDLDDVLKCYFECLRRWTEPSDQETLRTYLACVFIVSGCEENPMGELSKLIQAQHTEQHSTSESKSLSPSHCCRPKWTIPNTLKHYVLLHDSARDDESRTNDIFNQMCATYGVQSCQLLKIGVGPAEGLPDVWRYSDEANAILERGLALALEHARNSNKSDKREAPPTVISTISPSYAMVQSPTMSSPSSSVSDSGLSTPSNSRLASSADRESCAKLIEKFCKECLVPHVERQMRTLLDQLVDRRTIGKSLTSGMKKWFGGSATQSNNNQSQIYGHESPEMKSRRLADLAFQFGLYSFAHSQYRTVKKDFEGEQAWLYQAVAMEMAAVALHLANSSITGRQFPIHYLDNSLNTLLNNSGKYTAVMRCALNTANIYYDLGMYKEAALLFSRISILDNDQCVGVGQAKAAGYFRDGKQMRKSSFYYVLAGKRFMNESIKRVALECYKLSLPEYFEKNWEGIEDHLCSLLSGGITDMNTSQLCASRLLRGSEWQSETKQREFLHNFVNTLLRFSVGELYKMPLPILNSNDIRVICGERPLSDEILPNVEIDWNKLERSAFYSVAGSSTAFRLNQLVSDSSTENLKILDTPPSERFRVFVELRNPLVTNLELFNVRLGVSDVKYHEGSSGAPLSSQLIIPSLVFSGEEVKNVELWLLPSPNVSGFLVDSIHFELGNEQNHKQGGIIPLSTKGKRLNKTQKQMKGVFYAADERLRANVASEKWPLLDIKVHQAQQETTYNSQIVKLNLDIQNISDQVVTKVSLATDGIDNVDIQLEDDVGQTLEFLSQIDPTNCSVRIFELKTTLEPNACMKLIVNIRANETETPVAMLLLYKGEKGTYRHWRTVVPITSTPILEVKSHVLDASRGLVALQCRNCIDNSDAAMAKLDILRVRSVYQKINEKGVWLPAVSNVKLVPVDKHQIQLDGEQSDNICFFMSGSASDPSESEIWLGDKVTVPQWPSPQPVWCEDEPNEEDRQIAIYWKASVVANDGHVSIFSGELFRPCPFNSASVTIPGIPAFIPSNSKETGLNRKSSQPLVALCKQINPIKHSFTKSRLCYVPFSIQVINQDDGKRDISVALRFQQKVSEAVNSLDQVAPDSRLLWWPDKAVSFATIGSGKEHEFSLNIRVSQPSIYELGGSQMMLEGRYVNSEERFVIEIPSTLAIVHPL